jgi:UDP-3-O-[3-hydroxymyristoyl] glucosamine N-acyltransferase
MLMEHTLAELNELLHGELIGDGTTVIRGVSGFDAVKEDDLTFAEDHKRLVQAIASQAAAIIVSMDVPDLQGRSGIRVPNPKLAFASLLELFYPVASHEPGVHATAVLGKNVQLAEGVAVCAHAVIGDEVCIGYGTTVGAGVSVGDGVRIGKQCVLDPNVVVYRQTQIGDRVLIHGGSVIGGDGFGYIFHNGAYVKVPQVGNVVIEDDVEIGCNVCIDRSTIGSTLIRRGTKIDNLVQIAHNNHIGKHVILAGQVGLSGSVTVGDYTVMGGRAGVSDHVTIGDRVQVGIASLLTKSVPSGQSVLGYPARATNDVKRQWAALARLPQWIRAVTLLLAQVRRQEERLNRLEAQRSPERSPS